MAGPTSESPPEPEPGGPGEPAVKRDPPQAPDAPDKDLSSSEIFWYKHRDWLKSKGYTLRARYQQGWTPSWKGSKKHRDECEDGQVRIMAGPIMDAVHDEDGAFVVLKQVSKKTHPFEVDIATWLSAEPQRSDPENHCVPIREVLQSPRSSDIQFIVMPLLQPYDKPRFDSVGEAVEFFKQIFQGMRFMHKHNVAHRDCTHNNIMMDGSPLYSTPFHPVDNTMKRDYSGKVSHRSRTQAPVKYYLTDFGISRRYQPEDFPVLEGPILAGDRSAPEFKAASDYDEPPDCDPFPTDVYYIGNMIREDFTKGCLYRSRKRGFEFMEPLVADMVKTDPSARPTMDEVVARFEKIVQGLSTWKLRSEVVKDRQTFLFFVSISHWILKLRLIVGRYPPIPTP